MKFELLLFLNFVLKWRNNFLAKSSNGMTSFSYSFSFYNMIYASCHSNMKLCIIKTTKDLSIASLNAQPLFTRLSLLFQQPPFKTTSLLLWTHSSYPPSYHKEVISQCRHWDCKHWSENHFWAHVSWTK